MNDFNPDDRFQLYDLLLKKDIEIEQYKQMAYDWKQKNEELQKEIDDINTEFDNYKKNISSKDTSESNNPVVKDLVKQLEIKRSIIDRLIKQNIEDKKQEIETNTTKKEDYKPTIDKYIPKTKTKTQQEAYKKKILREHYGKAYLRNDI